jgi:hypothetical protein
MIFVQTINKENNKNIDSMIFLLILLGIKFRKDLFIK